MDWYKGKSTGNHGFYIYIFTVKHDNMGVCCKLLNMGVSYVSCKCSHHPILYENVQKPVTSPCNPVITVVGTDQLAEAQEQHEDDRGRSRHGMRQGNHVSPDHVDQLPEKNQRTS